MNNRVLIIEDDTTLAKNIARFLTRHGYVMTVAHDIGSALSELRLNAVDVVLLDIELPDGNGLDAYPDMRQFAPRLKGIVMTGSARPEHKARASEMHLGGFLSKPFSLMSLAQCIGTLDQSARVSCDQAGGNSPHRSPLSR